MKPIALLALALASLLAACSSPPPTNGAEQPVDPHTGVQQGGSSSVN